MKTFQVGQLMVSLQSGIEAHVECRCTHVHTYICDCTYRITLCPRVTMLDCPGHTAAYCGPGSAPCVGSDLPRPTDYLTDYIKDTIQWVEVAPTVFQDLKASLRQALDFAEQQEKVASESMKPKTQAQAVELEGKLQEALKEVAALKAKLK